MPSLQTPLSAVVVNEIGAPAPHGIRCCPGFIQEPPGVKALWHFSEQMERYTSFRAQIGCIFLAAKPTNGSYPVLDITL